MTTNVERLHAEGIVDAANLTEDEKTAIETMTSEEVDVLISLSSKVGSPDADRRHHASPNIIV